MHYRIAVCDDEPNEIAYLSGLVNKWSDNGGRTVLCKAYSSAEAFFCESEGETFDIILLDIEMGKMNGVELAKIIREQNKIIQIIFVTGYMEYISDGYEVEALHYLLKPVSPEKLFEILDRAAEKIKHAEKFLLIKTDGRSAQIPLHEIRFLEVRRNYTYIHAREDYLIKRPLSEFENELGGDFFRAGRSFLINLKYIRKVTKTEIYLSDTKKIPLSRGLYDAVNRAMIDAL